MSDLVQLLVFTALAGAAIPVGGLVGMIERVRPSWLEAELRHTIIAVGGGALLSAVCLVLVPEGIHRLPVWAVIAAMSAGGLVTMGLERLLAAFGGSAGQILAMLLDYLPESLALGALFAEGNDSAPVLALIVAAQNLPEGFNAQRELVQKGLGKALVLGVFLLLIPLGPGLAMVGKTFLAGQPGVLGAILLFAAGGILYLVFQDIAPQVRLERRWAPPLGAVFGFLIGLAGELVLGGGA